MVYGNIPSLPTSTSIFVRSMESALPASMQVYGLLTSDGTASMNTDGSSSVKTFSYASTGNTMLHRCLVHIVDGSINPVDFAGINSGVANGLRINVTDSDGTMLNTFGTDVIPIINNTRWVLLAGTDIDRDTSGPGNDALTIRWSFDKSGTPIMLSAGESFNIEIRDDLTAVSQFHVLLQGHAL